VLDDARVSTLVTKAAVVTRSSDRAAQDAGPGAKPNLRLKIDWGILTTDEAGNSVRWRLYWPTRPPASPPTCPPRPGSTPTCGVTLLFHEKSDKVKDATDQTNVLSGHDTRWTSRSRTSRTKSTTTRRSNLRNRSDSVLACGLASIRYTRPARSCPSLTAYASRHRPPGPLAPVLKENTAHPAIAAFPQHARVVLEHGRWSIRSR